MICKMSSERDEEQLSALEKMAGINWDSVDAALYEDEFEELYITLYEIRKRVNEVIVK